MDDKKLQKHNTVNLIEIYLLTFCLNESIRLKY